MEWLTSPEIWIAFFTLTALEIVLGIDNIIMIAILVGRVPKAMQAKTRFFGLALAMVTRIMLLLSITWVMRLTNDLFNVFGQGISGRDLILFFGGLFLLWKSSMEIYHGLEGEDETADEPKSMAGGFLGTIVQIAIIDIVFSLDSVITAVGMVSNVPVMVAAIIVAVLVMMLAAGTISDFIDKHPSLKMLALSFLTVVGTVLIAEAFDVRGEGLMLGIELVADRETRTPFDPALQAGLTFDRIAYENGLIGRCMGDTLGFSPPLIVTEKDVDDIAELCEKSLKQLQVHLQS